MSECNSVELTYHQRHSDLILNRAKDYYENDKERLRGQPRDKYRNLSPKYVERKKTMAKRISKKLSRGKKVST